MDNRLRRVFPDLKVLIVGRSPTAEVRSCASRPGVVVTGSVPDVRPYYRQAWLQIVPLRIGGGSRLKIVESMAMGTPVVSTRIGAQGLGLIHNRDALLADNTEAFLRETGRALCDVRLREQIEAAGIRTAHARFSWKSIGAQLNKFYSERFVGS
jgi:glycosyltransferase involved in cell wall biosynthesis